MSITFFVQMLFKHTLIGTMESKYQVKYWSTGILKLHMKSNNKYDKYKNVKTKNHIKA